MHAQSIQVENANINRPLNQAVQQANGAQFALMLSLLFESQGRAQPLAASEPAAVNAVAARQQFNLDNSLNQALQNNQVHQFNLLRSLYAERVVAAQTGSGHQSCQPEADDVLNEIEQTYQPGNARLGAEAQKISLASTAAAA